MYNISHKYKRFLFLLLKLVLVIGAFYFMCHKLTHNPLLSISELQQQLFILFSKSFWILILLLLFTDLNWLLEIYKWKILASNEKKLSFFDATQQSLASLSASLITPNRIGEYGVKAFCFEKKSRKKIVLLNFLGNMSQLAATTFFGIIGLVFLFTNFNAQIPYLNNQHLFFLVAFVLLLILSAKKLGFAKIGYVYFNKIVVFLKQIPKTIYSKTLVLSLLRYLVFSHQFYFLLRIFGIETAYFTLMNLLFCIYFIASIIPSFIIFDWAIKGSIAVFIFSFIQLNELIIISITTIMWLLNFAFPALLGSIFVLNFKLINNK